MNIITESYKNGRVKDGIATILKLDDSSFGRVLLNLNPNRNVMESFCFYYVTDQSELPSNPMQLGLEIPFEDGKTLTRGYFAKGARVETNDLLAKMEKLLEGFPENSKERGRIEALLAARGLDSFKGYFSQKYRDINYKVIDKAFEILSNEELFNKFMNYKENEQEFLIDGVENPKKEILRCIALAFGKKKEGDLQGQKEIFTDFYIPDMETYKEKVLTLYSTFNYVRYTDSRYEFNEHFSTFERIDPKEEPDFEISKELREAVYKDMPEDLSDEEKVVFIYSRLCKELLYNEEYMYKDKLGDDRYESDFSKEVLESKKPGSKVTCYDFSRIFAKMCNEISDDTEAIIMSPGQGRGHFLVGVFTERMSAEFDAINLEIGGHTDDLMKAKAGVELAGIQPRYDNEEALKNALKKIYPMAIGKPRTRMQIYLDDIRSAKKPEFQDDLELQIRTFVGTMKEENIVGNEFVQTLTCALYEDYFSEPLERAYIGRKSEEEGKKHFTRLILLRPRDYYVRKRMEDLYLIDTGNLQFSKTPKIEIADKLQTGEYVYEDDLHRMKGIE